jgi:WS/DGAT/MGAT family acyltransferase
VDAAWLRMERPDNPMVVTALMRLEGELDREALLALVSERLLRHRRFAQRPSHPRGRRVRGRRVAWEDVPGFTPAAHVHEAPPDLFAGVAGAEGSPQDAPRAAAQDAAGAAEAAEAAEAAVRAWVGRLMSRPLPDGGAPWEVHRVARVPGGGGTLLVWRLHHALADGSALLRVLLDVTDAPPSLVPARARGASSAGGARGAGGGAGWLLRGAGLLGRGVLALGRLALLVPDRDTPLRQALSGEKRVGWSAPVPLARVKALGRRAGATVNDVLVGAVSGALQRQVQAAAPPPGGPVAGAGPGVREVRALVPVDLRPPGAAGALGNHFGLLFLPLPLAAPSAPARLREAKRRMDALKRGADAVVAFRLLQVLGHLTQALATLAIAIFGAKASTVFTNVAGPTRPLVLAGRRVEGLLFWVPQAARLGVGLSVFSYAGQVQLGVAADAACLPAPQALADAFLEELALLEAALPEGPQGGAEEGAQDGARDGARDGALGAAPGRGPGLPAGG